jgi:predicted amidophosphoribosyltransferase
MLHEKKCTSNFNSTSDLKNLGALFFEYFELFWKFKNKVQLSLIDLFKCCSICESFCCLKSGLCRVCENYLIHKISQAPNNRIYLNEEIEVIYLLTWNQKNNELISRLIHSMKGTQGKSEWIFWAQFLSFEAGAEGDAILIPAPSSQLNLSDHAFLFAESLSQITGLELKRGLIKEPQQSQKKLNKNERSKIKLQSNLEFSEAEITERSYIFIDDVCTTGATILAAHEALGKPDNFKAIVLVYRELLHPL